MMAPLIRSLASLASVALWLGPPRFRAEYGSEVVADLEALLQAERQRRGPAAMLVLWMRGLGDAVKAARRERRLATPPPRAGRPFGDMSGDLRGALRGARRSPALSATIVLTLVFGIGLASAIFAFGDGYLFRPLPYANADELYLVRAPEVRGEFLRAAEAEALRTGHLAHLGFVNAVESAAVGFGTLQICDRAVRVNVDGVGENVGQLLGVPLVAGRHFTAEDHRSGGAVPVWLTYSFWQREFGGDSGVIGRRMPMTLAGQGIPAGSSREIEVIGITDPRITTFDVRFGRSNMLPAAFAPGLIRPPPANVLRTPIVRLTRDWPVDRATAAIAAALQTIAPAANGATRTVRLDPLGAEIGKAGRSTAALFAIGAAFALALVTINLVHLLLTRSATRTAEIATRAALGASRWRIARLFLVESLAHGAVGIGGGLLLGWWLTAVLAANIPARGSELGTLAVVVMQFDARVIGFAVVVGLVVALVGGVWPAWRASRLPLGAAARSTSGGGSRLAPRLSRVLLVSEVAVSTVVLVGAVFAGIGLWRFVTQPLGYDLEGRYSVAFPDAPGATDSVASIDWLALNEALRKVEGVEALGSSIDEVRVPVRAGDRVFDRREALVGTIGMQYFVAAGLHLKQGRFPDDNELRAIAPVAVIDERFARTVWPSASAVGNRVQVGDVAYDVVGVVASPRYSLIRETPPVVFVPAAPVNERGRVTVVAPRLSADELKRRFDIVVSQAAPGVSPNVQALTFERQFDDELANARFQRPIIVVLGLFAFTVAGVGLFGLIAYLVEQRTRDFGIRMALGARPSHIRRQLVAESLWPAGIGLAIGLAAAWGLEGVMRASMFGWESSGTMASAGVAIAILGVALGAVAGPARRVFRIDPVVTLRAE